MSCSSRFSASHLRLPAFATLRNNYGVSERNKFLNVTCQLKKYTTPSKNQGGFLQQVSAVLRWMAIQRSGTTSPPLGVNWHKRILYHITQLLLMSKLDNSKMTRGKHDPTKRPFFFSLAPVKNKLNPSKQHPVGLGRLSMALIRENPYMLHLNNLMVPI